ncbi:MAG: DUF4143 domain-containing protein [Candidatus Nanopelagicales bacterium]
MRSRLEQAVTRDASELSHGTDPVKVLAYFEALALDTAGLAVESPLCRALGITATTAARHDEPVSDFGIATRIPAWATNRLQRPEKRGKRYGIDGGLSAVAAGFDVGALRSAGDLLERMIDTFVHAQIAPGAVPAEHPVGQHHVRTATATAGFDRLLAAAISSTWS